MGDAAGNQVGQVLDLTGITAGDERGSGNDGERERIEGRLDIAARSRFRSHFLHRGRRGLAGRQSVNLVVHDDVGDVQISPHGVDEVAQTDAVAVAVAAGDNHVQLVVRQLRPGRHRHRPPVKAMDPVGVHKSRQIRRAADA